MLLDIEITYFILCSFSGDELNEHTDSFPHILCIF